MKPNVSVVLTVYNTAKYLRQCLDSLIAQTLKNIEIICVDDASEDDSVKILKEYQKRDKRISIIVSSVNKGINYTRNTGLKKVCGKYAVILDSDDFYEQTFLEKLYLQAQNTDADITFCGFDVFDDKTQTVQQIDWDINRAILPKTQVFSMLPELFNLAGTIIWKNLYKVEFLKQNNLKFENRLSYTDGVFSKTTLLKAKRISYIDEKLVYYRVNNKNSFSHNLSFSGAIRLIYAWARLLEKENLLDKYREAFLQASLMKMAISLRAQEPYSSLLRSFYQKYLIPKFWEDAEIPNEFSTVKLIDNCSDKFKRLFFLERQKIIPIVLATDNNSLPRTMVVLQSILENAHPDYFYDVYVLHSSLSAEKCFDLILQTAENLRVSCVNMAEKSGQKNGFKNYFLYIPELFAGYDKILYLDNNALVVNDLTKLMLFDLDNKLVGGLKKELSKTEYEHYKKTTGTVLSEQIESKIILFNLEMFRQHKLNRVLMQNFEVLQKKGISATETLNFSCGQYVAQLPKQIASEVKNTADCAVETEVLVYDSAEQIEKDANLAFAWWKVARNSVFYELLALDYRLKLIK